ncbi:RNase H domain-containing protein [Trichonephila clavipes]|nr:RNase H domain-containing protein [Trichonephila clavipes]
MTELKQALLQDYNTSRGPDRITYTMLRHLNPDSLINILYLFNRVWKEHYYPSSWREAIVILILGQKVATDPLSCRLIALTSCCCKTFECMINTHLVYVLEKEKCISHLCRVNSHYILGVLWVSAVPGFLPDDRYTAILVELRGGWRHTRMKMFFRAYGFKSAVPGSLNTFLGVISEPDLATTSEAEILDRFSDQGVIQVARTSTTPTTTQTDENITKIVCPPLKLRQPFISTRNRTISSSVLAVIKSSTSIQAQIVPSTSSLIVTSSESQPPIPLIDITPTTSNSLSTSAASSTNTVSMFTPLPSCPVLQTTTTTFNTTPSISEDAKLSSKFRKKKKNVHLKTHFCWLPSHVGITGNKQADIVARSATTELSPTLALCDMKCVIEHRIHNAWQESWDLQTNNKLHCVKPVIGALLVMPMRGTDVKLTRLRIGHTRFTYRHLLLECYRMFFINHPQLVILLFVPCDGVDGTTGVDREDTSLNKYPLCLSEEYWNVKLVEARTGR